mgnify:CR=1 FL=1
MASSIVRQLTCNVLSAFRPYLPFDLLAHFLMPGYITIWRYEYDRVVDATGSRAVGRVVRSGGRGRLARLRALLDILVIHMHAVVVDPSAPTSRHHGG